MAHTGKGDWSVEVSRHTPGLGWQVAMGRHAKTLKAGMAAAEEFLNPAPQTRTTSADTDA